MVIQDILAALGGLLNGISQSVMAMTFGFAMLPSALAYVVGILGVLIFNSPIPISFQAETMVMAGSMGKNMRERLSIVILAGAGMTIIGALGLLESIVDFAGANVTAAMMAGVGIILVKISIDMAREDKKIGVSSLAAGIIAYLITQNLVYTSLASIVVSAIFARYLKMDNSIKISIDDKFKFQMPIVNTSVIRGALSVMCITVGGNIAFGRISAAISQAEANIDHITIYSGLADVASALFGGSPISVVISPTAAAPNPKWAAVILMALMAIVLLTKTLPKIVKHIPPAAVAGTLFVLGAALTLPPNLQDAFANTTPSGALASSVALVVTATIDPFVGLVAGVIVNLLAAPLGL